MQKLEELEKWVANHYDSQAEAAAAIGTTQTTISKWISGKQGVSKAFQRKLKKLHYEGPFEIEAHEDLVTRREFNELFEAVEDACAVISALVKSMPEGSRPLVLPKRFR